MSLFCNDEKLEEKIEKLETEVKRLREELDIIRYATTIDSIAKKLEKKIETMAAHVINELRNK